MSKGGPRPCFLLVTRYSSLVAPRRSLTAYWHALHPSTIRVIDRANDQAVTVRIDGNSPNVEIQLEGHNSAAPPAADFGDAVSLAPPAGEHELLADAGVDTPARELPAEPPPSAAVIDPSQVFESPGFIALESLQTRDNLQVLEGVSPELEALLNQHGITTYRQLAATDVRHLQQLLGAAGAADTSHDPGTWLAQANLAANGQWETLRAVQTMLRAGKRPV